MFFGCFVTLAISISTFFWIQSITKGTPLEGYVWIPIAFGVVALAFSGNVWGILVAIKQKNTLGKLVDGKVCGFSGRLTAKKAPLSAPFSKKEGVFIEYEASKDIGTGNNRREIGYHGLMKVPSMISSMKGTITLTGFPVMTQIKKTVVSDLMHYSNAKEFLSTVKFSEGNPLKEIQKLANDEVSEIHTIRGTPEFDESYQLVETVVPQGEEVTVFGTFSAKDNTLDIGGISFNHSIQIGKGEAVVSRNLRFSIWLTVFFGLVLYIGLMILFEALGVDMLSPYCVKCKEIIRELTS